MPDKKLIIIGDGPEREKVERVTKNAPNITFLGAQPNGVLTEYMKRAKAFVFAAEEDFGIMPVEAQASGTPVIAYGAGGALETVIDIRKDPHNGTGMFFFEQTPESIKETVEEFSRQNNVIKIENCRTNAEKFSIEIFREKIINAIETAQNQNSQTEK